MRTVLLAEAAAEKTARAEEEAALDGVLQDASQQRDAIAAKGQEAWEAVLTAEAAARAGEEVREAMGWRKGGTEGCYCDVTLRD